jgi:hypothetical protein
MDDPTEFEAAYAADLKRGGLAAVWRNEVWSMVRTAIARRAPIRLERLRALIEEEHRAAMRGDYGLGNKSKAIVKTGRATGSGRGRGRSPVDSVKGQIYRGIVEACDGDRKGGLGRIQTDPEHRQLRQLITEHDLTLDADFVHAAHNWVRTHPRT